MSRARPWVLLFMPAMLTVGMLLGGCGTVRFALPMPAEEVVEAVTQVQADVDGLRPSDRVQRRNREDGRIHLSIDHRSLDARIKPVQATTEMMIQPLSRQSSEVILRSDHHGWLIKRRDRMREQDIWRYLRERAYASSATKDERSVPSD
ncbi:MAG: hypothetical protein EA401_05380 [Planctomycetota bacterium]|nr:MAG: hypothetical protein EA401_05380 [Planctomycetota bacterium]